MTPEIIVLCVTALVLVGVAAYFFWAWKRPMFPKGVRLTYTWAGYKVHLIVDGIPLPKTLREILVRDCAQVAQALEKAWGDREKKGNIKEFVVVFMRPDLFVYPNADDTSKIPAYLTTCSYRLGSGYLPMMVAKEKHIDEVISVGEPLIHELCHELLGEHTIDRQGHNEQDVWKENTGEDSIQHKASELYQEMV